MPAFDLPLDELRRYRPVLDEPADFDAFWQDTLKEAEEETEGAGPVVSQCPVDTGLRLVETWDVTFRGFAGEAVRAWYTRPAGVSGALPAVVEYAGYGRGRGLPHERITWPAAGFAHLLMDNRGQGDRYGCGGDTPDPHASAPGGPGPAARGLLAPRDYHYRRLITDAVRAVAAVRALPGVDGARVAAVGNSQGGGLALAVAGLVPDLAAVLVSAPLLCGIRRALDLAGAGPYDEIAAYLAVRREAAGAALHTLSYVEGASFARRAHAPAHFGVGLRDTVCPPSGAFSAFNRYGELTGREPRREMHTYPFNGHEGGDAVHVRGQLSWLRAVVDDAAGGADGDAAGGVVGD
ncbi:acetylxylan esterase [Streptomyces sp. NPDC059255]|uniref:acetylxylan esterase n=1 Tax=Streptomyces sp. NPDC059255 TaxID=3346793 RepID=UPI0036A9B04B